MATRDDLVSEVQSLRQLIMDDQAADQAIVDQLTGTIDTLTARVSELEGAQDFSDIIASLESIKAQVVPVTSTAIPAMDPTVPPGETEVPTEPPTV